MQTGYLDAFNDVYRVVYDWASGRTRLALRRVAESGDSDLAVLRSLAEDPRCPNLLDGSAVLNWLSGHEPAAPVGDEALDRRNEPRGLLTGDPMAPDNSFWDADQNPRRNLTIMRISYDETRYLIWWLSTFLDRTDTREKVAEWYRENPDYDPVGRLLRFTQERTLDRRGGLIRLPWFHPFEFGNDFIGWTLARQGDSEVIEPMWPHPAFAVGTEPPSGAYLLTREVVLYDGQRLVGDLSSVGLGFRDIHIAALRQSAEKTRFGLMSRVAPALRGDAAVDPPQVCFPDGPAERRRVVIGIARGERPVRGIELRDLHILLDTASANAMQRQLSSVIDLDGAEDGRVEHVVVEGYDRRAEPCADFATRCGGGTVGLIQSLPDSVVQMGVQRPTRGMVFRDCMLFVDPLVAIIRFGPQAQQNLWLGGEINQAYGSIQPVGTVGVWWEDGSIGNTMIGGSLEPRLAFGRARLRMDGRAGAVESVRIEPVRGTCVTQEGALSNCERQAPSDPPLLQLVDVVQETYADVEIGPTGRDNVLQWVPFLRGRITDLGTGTFARSWDGGFRGDLSGVLSPQTWNNLLANGRFRRRRSEFPCAWTVIGASRALETTIEGADGLKLVATRGLVVLTQVVAVWGEATDSIDERTDDFERHLGRIAVSPDGGGLEVCGETRRTSARSAFDGRREFVASVQVDSPHGVRIDLSLVPYSAGAVPQTTSVTSRGRARWLAVGLRVPHGTRYLGFQLKATGSEVSVAHACMVEGGHQPSDRVRPMDASGGELHGPLWLPGPTSMVGLSPEQPWVASVESRVVDVFAHGLDGPVPGPVELHVWRRRPTKAPELIARVRWAALLVDTVQGQFMGPCDVPTTLRAGDRLSVTVARQAEGPRGFEPLFVNWRVTLAVTQAV